MYVCRHTYVLYMCVYVCTYMLIKHIRTGTDQAGTILAGPLFLKLVKNFLKQVFHYTYICAKITLTNSGLTKPNQPVLF